MPLTRLSPTSISQHPKMIGKHFSINIFPTGRVVHDEKAIKFFYEGISLGESIPWGAWLIPLFAWTLYVFVLYVRCDMPLGAAAQTMGRD